MATWESHEISDKRPADNEPGRGNGYDDKLLKDVVTAKIDFIFSPTQEADWLDLREGIGDSQLLAVDGKVYIHHMQIIVAQLLMGSVAKALGGPGMFYLDPINGFARMASLGSDLNGAKLR